jgi:acyl-CoA dehydrogenase
VLNGAKTFISNGYNADLVCVVAKTDPGARARGISLLMVETRDLPGYRVGRILEKIGPEGPGHDGAVLRRLPGPGLEPARRRGGAGLFVQLMQELPTSGRSSPCRPWPPSSARSASRSTT